MVQINWASGHEFSMVSASPVLAYLGGRFLLIPPKKETRYFLAAIFFLPETSP